MLFSHEACPSRPMYRAQQAICQSVPANPFVAAEAVVTNVRSYRRCEQHIASQPYKVAGSERDLQVGIYKDTQLADSIEALSLLVQQGSYVHNSLFYDVLKRCIARKDLALGCRVHALAVKSGYGSNAFVANHLICMYASHGRLEEATQVFASVAAPNRYMWASIILAHARHGNPGGAIKFYRQMQESTVKPDNRIFVAVLTACATAEDLSAGRKVHADILGTANGPDIFVGNCLVEMYSKCGSLEDARRVFDSLTRKNVVTWTTMMSGYAQHGLGEEALKLYVSMQQEGVTPMNSVTFVCLLQACASARALQQGEQLHAQIKERGLERDVVIGTCLVDMYSKCGNLEDARRVFDNLPTRDVVTWTAMIAGYGQQGLGEESLALYELMQQEGITPANRVTFTCLLQACASGQSLHQGRQLHAQIHQAGLSHDVVVGTCLVDMYSKCGCLEDARRVFDNLPRKNVVTWNAMIAGYAQHGLCQEAFCVYGSMQQEGITAPDAVTFLALIQACSNGGTLHQGKQLHAEIRQRGLEADVAVGNSLACSNVAWLEKGKELHVHIANTGLKATDLSVANALVDMYGKCGSMVDAQQVFDALSGRQDIVTWNALIAGYARQGESDLVFHLVQRMRQEGIQPDSITFLSLLTACSHAGLVDQGLTYLESMTSDYGIPPIIEHYNCMVDLLGRAGHLDRAVEMAHSMPFQADTIVWKCLLGACQKWNNVELGLHAFKQAVALDKDDPAAYMLMSNIYSAAQMQDKAEEMQASRRQSQAWKQPGQSWWTDMAGSVHTFIVGDRQHPEWQHIDAELTALLLKLMEETQMQSASLTWQNPWRRSM